MGALFTIDVWPSFYQELEAHGVDVPNNLLFSGERSKGTDNSLWKPVLPSASLEERLTFAWNQMQFAKRSGAETKYTPGDMTDDHLTFLYQASAEDMVYLFPDGQVMMVNERAMLLEAFRQGVLAAAGSVVLGYAAIALALVVLAAPAAVAEISAAGSSVASGVQAIWEADSLYALALQNPIQAIALTHFAVGTALTIVDIGPDEFFDNLKTPQGAAMMLFEILSLGEAGPEGPAPAVTDEPEGELDELPTVPKLPGVSPEETEPDEAPTMPAGPAPGAAADEPATMMHEGRPVYGKPTDVEVGGEEHELVVTEEEGNGARVRMCSKSCDFVVRKLKTARTNLQNNGRDESKAIARINDLIARGEALDEKLEAASAAERGRFQPELDDYGNELTAAAKAYPEVGVELKDIRVKPIFPAAEFDDPDLTGWPPKPPKDPKPDPDDPGGAKWRYQNYRYEKWVKEGEPSEPPEGLLTGEQYFDKHAAPKASGQSVGEPGRPKHKALVDKIKNENNLVDDPPPTAGGRRPDAASDPGEPLKVGGKWYKPRSKIARVLYEADTFYKDGSQVVATGRAQIRELRAAFPNSTIVVQDVETGAVLVYPPGTQPPATGTGSALPPGTPPREKIR